MKDNLIKLGAASVLRGARGMLNATQAVFRLGRANVSDGRNAHPLEGEEKSEYQGLEPSLGYGVSENCCPAYEARLPGESLGDCVLRAIFKGGPLMDIQGPWENSFKAVVLIFADSEDSALSPEELLKLAVAKGLLTIG